MTPTDFDVNTIWNQLTKLERTTIVAAAREFRNVPGATTGYGALVAQLKHERVAWKRVNLLDLKEPFPVDSPPKQEQPVVPEMTPDAACTEPGEPGEAR